MVDITLPKGPWDSPLPQVVNTKRIKVLIHNLKTEAIDYEFTIDYGNYEHRKFLGKLTYYAVTNGKSVETLDAEEWEKVK